MSRIHLINTNYYIFKSSFAIRARQKVREERSSTDARSSLILNILLPSIIAFYGELKYWQLFDNQQTENSKIENLYICIGTARHLNLYLFLIYLLSWRSKLLLLCLCCCVKLRNRVSSLLKLNYIVFFPLLIFFVFNLKQKMNLTKFFFQIFSS